MQSHDGDDNRLSVQEVLWVLRQSVRNAAVGEAVATHGADVAVAMQFVGVTAELRTLCDVLGRAHGVELCVDVLIG